MRTMPPSGANANSDGRSFINQTSSRKPRQGFGRSICDPKRSLVRVTRLCSASKGINLSPFSSETGHPPRREEGLPTLTLEKLVPGGIAEVSPSHDRLGEGEGMPGFGPGSNPWADRGRLWASRIIIVIIKASVIPPTVTPQGNYLILSR